VLAVNDHVLKAAWPGVVTGKLSDVAGPVVVAIVIAVKPRLASTTDDASGRSRASMCWNG